MKFNPILMAAALSGVSVSFAAPIPSPMPLGGLARVIGKCFGCVDGSKAVRESISHTSELGERPAIPAWENPDIPPLGSGASLGGGRTLHDLRTKASELSPLSSSDSSRHSSPDRLEKSSLEEPKTHKKLHGQGNAAPLARQGYPYTMPDAYVIPPNELTFPSRPHSSHMVPSSFSYDLPKGSVLPHHGDKPNVYPGHSSAPYITTFGDSPFAHSLPPPLRAPGPSSAESGFLRSSGGGGSGAGDLLRSSGGGGGGFFKSSGGGGSGLSGLFGGFL
ncbi:uncharacterized protein UTRI_06542 [Ustilago trichophora]|uniref:Uncharacterized protein n=1 Tax=Ustilago trichophora TaxID=86804 RepID=A0A5C3ELT8_9BASI|nr:uncharacterized protein UTRI_06542 [Ustilago trichophora]